MSLARRSAIVLPVPVGDAVARVQGRKPCLDVASTALGNHQHFKFVAVDDLAEHDGWCVVPSVQARIGARGARDQQSNPSELSGPRTTIRRHSLAEPLLDIDRRSLGRPHRAAFPRAHRQRPWAMPAKAPSWAREREVPGHGIAHHAEAEEGDAVRRNGIVSLGIETAYGAELRSLFGDPGQSALMSERAAAARIRGSSVSMRAFRAAPLP